MPRWPDTALVVATDFAGVRALAEHLRAACAAADIDEGMAFEVELALVEAANNVVEHGHADRPPGTMALLLAFSGPSLTLTLSDAGTPLPERFFSHAAMPEGEALCGRGAAIILACCDRVDYRVEDGANHLTLERAARA